MSLIKTLFKQSFSYFGFEISLNKNLKYKNPWWVLEQMITSKEITIFDVGAHTGGVSINFYKIFPKAHIYSFEPFPDSFEKLHFITKSIPNINAYNLALSEKKSEVDFFVTSHNDSSSLLKPIYTGTFIDNHIAFEKKIKVKTISLDEFCNENYINTIDILKMDVQGAEKKILSGSCEMLSKKSIKFILTEVWFISAYDGQALYHHIATYLEQFGYKLFAVFNIHYKKDGQYLWGDAIFHLEK